MLTDSCISLSNVLTSLNIHIPVTTKDKKSATGTDNHTPSTPKKIGKIRTAGIKKRICLEIVITSAGKAFPIA
jgi:hypothetical protein